MVVYHHWSVEWRPRSDPPYGLPRVVCIARRAVSDWQRGLSAGHASDCRDADRRVTALRVGTPCGARATTRATDGARAVRVSG
jgi:hypothetical protein